MVRPLQHFPFSTLIFSLYLLSQAYSFLPATTNPDLIPLLNFKSISDPYNSLKTWNQTTDPCTSWTGISCLIPNSTRVSHLILEKLNLQGSLTHLTSLTHLRVLSLKNNHLSGPIPSSFSNLTSLKHLFLSHNYFSGPFPSSIPSLSRLYRLDLSFNSFSGPIPFTQLNLLTHLLTLRLENNRFTGLISGLNISTLQDFNVSSNQLTGQIPTSLSRFPRSVFSQNRALCGYPLQACKSSSGSTVPKPTQPRTENSNSSTLTTSTVSSTPSSLLPLSTNYPEPTHAFTHRYPNKKKGISKMAIIAIVLGDVLILVLVSILLFCYFSNKTHKTGRKRKLMETTEKIVYSSSPYLGANQGNNGSLERGRMVFFQGAKRFELDDLLRASAEMLGKGGFGTAYKAVLDDGSVVAVKRLKDGGGKREFEQKMEVLGRLRHPNLLGFKAYYFAMDEKLLVYDYIPNGSLFWLLHGNRGPGRIPLDWTTRLRIAAGAARGLAFIHGSCKALKLADGNIKSTNILLDKSGNARVSDFGLPLLVSTSSSINKSNGYRAPELPLSDGRKTTQKSDVYSFGVLLLEILTGKCPLVVDCSVPGNAGPVDLPRWVQSVVREEWTAEVFDLELMRYKDIEEDMVGLLQVAMACTSPSPDQRPTMCHVVEMIEEIRGVEVSPCLDNFDSVSYSPCLSKDTCGAASK